MRREVDLHIKSNYHKLYKEKNYPLIIREYIEDSYKLKEEGSKLRLLDKDNNFIGRGYYGIQNKGVGWILSFKENEKINRNFFQKKLITALNKRKNFFNQKETNTFRVFNSIGDGIGGLTIDYYDDFYLFNWYSQGVYSFREEIYEIFKSLVYFKGIYQKKRFKDKGKYIDGDDFVLGERGNFPIIVKENGVKILVDLNDGPMVGFFIDQRQSRKILKERYSKNKDILNTFSYTGIFSVFAALGEANSTTSVDLANRSYDKTKALFEINDLDLNKNHIIVEDIFEYFNFAIKKDLKFDTIILDPPSFAKSKNYIFKVDKDYKTLITNSIKILKPNGVIIASTNFEKFTLQDFKKEIKKGILIEERKYEFLEKLRLPIDFEINNNYPEGNYLKVFYVRIY